MPTKLPPIHCLNDYVAVLLRPITTAAGIVMPGEAEIKGQGSEKFNNEGIVVGVGPDARGIVDLGDQILVRANHYLKMKPVSGPYSGRTVFMAHKPDLVAKVAKAEGDEVYEFEPLT